MSLILADKRLKIGPQFLPILRKFCIQRSANGTQPNFAKPWTVNRDWIVDVVPPKKLMAKNNRFFRFSTTSRLNGEYLLTIIAVQGVPYNSVPMFYELWSTTAYHNILQCSVSQSIAQCSGHLNTKACPPTIMYPAVIFQLHMSTVLFTVYTKRKTKRIRADHLLSLFVVYTNFRSYIIPCMR